MIRSAALVVLCAVFLTGCNDDKPTSRKPVGEVAYTEEYVPCETSGICVKCVGGCTIRFSETCTGTQLARVATQQMHAIYGKDRTRLEVDREIVERKGQCVLPDPRQQILPQNVEVNAPAK